ncbi:MAG TPA: M48 family metalloprotease [Pyrinomonadaceae bacterium]
MPTKILFALALCLSVFCPAAAAQQDCAPPGIVANAKSSNIFTPEQEMIFGELTIQNMAGEVRFVRDEKLLAYVNEIGARLAKHLPPTGLKFQFHLVDIGEANAFNIPGGHVMLSRKLVAFASNEDELAGVIAHELGHAVVRHGAADVSESLKKILNVTSLGDRADITEKYNLLIERARTKSFGRRRGHEDEQQLEADRAGLYAMIAAGYDPAAFSSFFDRLTESEGKTGGWFSDLFGKTRPEQKRLREMSRLTERVPPACREGRAASATDNFLRWQADVVSFREAGRTEELPGLVWKKELQPKLRGDVSHLSFSADGRLLLVQDDFSVTVVERASPPRVLFQIPVEDANEAAFTPDGKYVVLTTENLRYEKWGVAERRPVEVREMVVRADCWEHKLSPDGNYLACVDITTTVNVLDTRTGKKVWEKKEFYPLSIFEYFSWLVSARDRGGDGGGGGGDAGVGFFRIEFSPDSRFVMFSRSERFRFRIRYDVETLDSSENTALALDLTTFKPAEIGGDVKKISARAYVFLDAGRVLGMPSRKLEEAGVFSFPAGKRLQKFALAASEIKRTASGDHVIIKPLANARMGIFDMKKGVIVSGLNKADATMWENLTAYESASGKILLREVSYDEAKKQLDARDAVTIDIPVGHVRGLRAADVSNNFSWLALSSKSRGGVWHLETGERKFHVRGFRGGVMADDGTGVVDFPRFDDTPHGLVVLKPSDNQTFMLRELPDKGARQHGRFVLTRRSLKEKKTEKADQKSDEKSDEKKAAKNDVPPFFGGQGEGGDLQRDVRFELKDFIQDKLIWSRDFQKEAPEFSFDEFSGRLTFYYRLGGEAGKAKLKEMAELRAKADALGNKDNDYLVEIVDAFAQKTVGAMLLETGKGSFNVGRALSEGDWLVLRDSERRVLVYSLRDGALRHRFFGDNAAVNPKKNQLAVENFPGEVSLYDLDTGARLTSFVVNGGAALVRFNLEGDRLFVLSSTQAAYAFDLNKIAPKASARAN